MSGLPTAEDLYFKLPWLVSTRGPGVCIFTSKMDLVTEIGGDGRWPPAVAEMFAQRIVEDHNFALGVERGLIREVGQTRAGLHEWKGRQAAAKPNLEIVRGEGQ
jgi:hypothetical protein